MSNLNKKIRKVQKGGFGWSDFTGGLGTATDKLKIPASTFSQASDKLKSASSFGDIATQLENLTEDDRTEEKLNSLKTSKFADETVWDMFWEEPCYIDPATGHIVISKIKSLWCTFQSKDLEELLDPPTDNSTEVTIADINQCKEEFFKNKFGKSPDEIKQDISAHSQFNKLINQIKKNNKIPIDPSYNPPKGDTKYEQAYKQLEQYCPDSIEKAEMSNNMDVTNLVFNPPTGGDIEKTGGSGPKECNNIKWIFCFIFKFILGPGGFFIIKLLPHMIKFYYAMKESIDRIFTGLGNTLRDYNLLRGDTKKYYYYGKLKERNEDGSAKYGIVDDYEPNFFDTIFSYLGSVIPWNYVNYNMGQKYGKGEFGKLIVGLVIVSAVIIIIGGVGVTMLFLCFAFYCMKTLSMFSDNIKEKGKGKA